MSNAINKKKIDHQRVRRQQVRSVKKARLAQPRYGIRISADAASMDTFGEDTALLATVSASPLPLTDHHRRARKSNPRAPIQLSKKKEKRLRKLTRIAKLLISQDHPDEGGARLEHSRLMQE